MPRKNPRRQQRPTMRRKVDLSNKNRLPQVQIIPTVHTVMRFTNRVSNNGSTSLAVTSQNLIAAAGILASGANSGYPFHGFFQINKICMWSGVNASTSFAQAPTIGIRWFNTVSGTLGDTNTYVSDSSLSTADVARVVTVPPRGSAASWWSGPSTNTIFNVFTSFTTAVFLDIHCEFRINDNANGAVASVTTTNTMSLGNVYFPALDGTSANLWTRVIPNTIN